MNIRISSTLAWHLELVSILIHKEVKVRYKSSVLGWFWSVGHPLLFATIYYFVFSQVMRIPIEHYPIFLLAGLFPWQWLTSSVNHATTLFLNNKAIIKKTAFPRAILPFSLVLTEGIHFLLTLPVLILFLLIADITPSWCWLWGVPLLFMLQLIFLTGIACLLASLTLFLRDLERFVHLSLMLLLYATPVLYSPEMIPARWQWLVRLNPVATLIEEWRELFMSGRLDLSLLPQIGGGALLVLLMGLSVHRALSPFFAEVL